MICSGSTAKKNETTEIGVLLHLYYETHCGEKGTFSVQSRCGVGPGGILCFQHYMRILQL